jgi:thiamine pyrophosphate-dependent acetolactate synthase large subunit-like protein
MDVETAARSEIPILTVILNNGVMTHYYEHFPYATEHWQSNQLSGEYATVAQGLGAYGEKVESPDDVAAAIRRGLEANREGRPAVLEMITKEEENVAKYW